MIHRSGRRHFIAGSAALSLAAIAPSLARAQAWPAKPVRIVVSFPAGGLTDVLARAYGEQLGLKLGQTFIIENKPGAGGMIGNAEVAKAAPDGYTFLFTISTTFNQNRVLYKKVPYDPEKDFVFVSGFDAGHLPLAVSAGVKAANVREFVELAKTQRMTIGTYAPGSVPHMIGQQLNKLYGTQIEAVHYRGESPMWTDLASGQIHAAVGSISAMLPHAQSGKVRPIAVPTMARSPRLPEVPTFAEQGFSEPVFVIQGWIGMFGPAGTRRDIVNRISGIVQEAADSPRIKTLKQNFGLPPKPWTADEFEKLQAEIGPQWIALARELGVTLD